VRLFTRQFWGSGSVSICRSRRTEEATSSASRNRPARALDFGREDVELGTSRNDGSCTRQTPFCGHV